MPDAIPGRRPAEKGDTGSRGERGERGGRGERGTAGSPGRQGTAGRAGSPGQNYVLDTGRRQSMFNLAALALAVVALVSLGVGYVAQGHQLAAVVAVSHEQSATAARQSTAIAALSQRDRESTAFFAIICQSILAGPGVAAQTRMELQASPVCRSPVTP